MVKLGVILLVKLDGAEENDYWHICALRQDVGEKLIPELVVHRKYGNTALSYQRLGTKHLNSMSYITSSVYIRTPMLPRLL
jgi:hypothetical protein